MKNNVETTKHAAIDTFNQHIKYLELWIKNSDDRIRMWSERKQTFQDRLTLAQETKAKLEQATSLDEIKDLLDEAIAKRTNFQIKEKQS